MRFYVLVLWGMLTISYGYSQNYAPFNASVSKRFYEVNHPDSNDYFFYADSVSVAGMQTVFHQYFTVRGDGPVGAAPSGCYFWGGSTGHVLDTTWLGVDVSYDAAQRLLSLRNAEGDTLHFNFMLAAGDSALVYENASDRYFLKYDSTGYETVYSVVDSVKQYRLLHYDINGNPSPSPLNGFVIKLGKTSGLLSFLDVYHFPQAEVGLALQGQLNPLLGTYHMTYEELYPWQPGDVLQYHGNTYSQYGTCNTWTTYEVTGRSETVDSIYFSLSQTQFSITTSSGAPVPSYSLYIPQNFGVPKHLDVLGRPFNKASGPNARMTGLAEVQHNFCDERYAIKKGESFATYCDSCRCYGGVDGFMSQVVNETYVKGLGKVQSGYSEYDLSSSGNAELTYYSISGQTCGALAHQGVAEYALPDFMVSPNPSAGAVRTSLPFTKATLMDLQGKTIHSVSTPGSELDISTFPDGTYQIEFEVDGYILHRKIVKVGL